MRFARCALLLSAGLVTVATPPATANHGPAPTDPLVIDGEVARFIAEACAEDPDGPGCDLGSLLLAWYHGAWRITQEAPEIAVWLVEATVEDAPYLVPRVVERAQQGVVDDQAWLAEEVPAWLGGLTAWEPGEPIYLPPPPPYPFGG